MKQIGLVLVIVAFNVVGQMLLKHAMVNEGEIVLNIRTLPSLAVRLFSKPPVLIGLFFYAAGAFFWLVLLSRMELSVAYPMMSLSYIVLMFLSWQFFDEQLTNVKIAGTAMICIGIVLLTLGQKSS